MFRSVNLSSPPVALPELKSMDVTRKLSGQFLSAPALKLEEKSEPFHLKKIQLFEASVSDDLEARLGKVKDWLVDSTPLGIEMAEEESKTLANVAEAQKQNRTDVAVTQGHLGSPDLVKLSSGIKDPSAWELLALLGHLVEQQKDKNYYTSEEGRRSFVARPVFKHLLDGLNQRAQNESQEATNTRTRPNNLEKEFKNLLRGTENVLSSAAGYNFGVLGSSASASAPSSPLGASSTLASLTEV